MDMQRYHPVEKQATSGPGGRILTNTGVWSPDSQWIVYDTRSDAAGEKFDGQSIEIVHWETGEIRTLYRSRNQACCGVPTFHPIQNKVAFILGPENPTPDWQYGPYHRQGVIVETTRPDTAMNMDARDLTAPLTPGALRGGSHVHVWHPAGDWISFTYEDHLLAAYKTPGADHDINQRNIGVSMPGKPVRVKMDHPRNHDGEYFTILATRTTATPAPGSDEILKAFEEGWIGRSGYVAASQKRQLHSLAFQGHVVTAKGDVISEVFIADLPEDLARPGSGPLEGTLSRMPSPPAGTTQRRLTHTASRKYPGIQGPRHWLRSSPDGSRIAFLMKDDDGVVQLWTISPLGGSPVQITRNRWSISSTFTWSASGKWVAHIMDQCVCVTEIDSGNTTRLTPRFSESEGPRPEACVVSPDGRKIAYIRRTGDVNNASNQIFVTHLAVAL